MGYLVFAFQVELLVFFEQENFCFTHGSAMGIKITFVLQISSLNYFSLADAPAAKMFGDSCGRSRCRSVPL